MSECTVCRMDHCLQPVSHRRIATLEVDLSTARQSLYEVVGQRNSALDERDELRAFVSEMANEFWGFREADAEDFQNYAVSHGIIVAVPATPEFKAKWEAEEMFVLSWNRAAREARK